ncbi:PTS mannitol transporter subunit IICBA [Collibacillus ludicampi]|jgi:PTS system mannitol-specific IIC component|uniref:Mannitol-specific phosphotransferase enzyme IIA component n=1 Tax=Collibacillus ludicampi TaxID=2771369 RepID=A0AAV4LG05_9BACL|nr:PTS mannitol transporter subunit IICBA [Collibacillus ludicampi]GIM46732.1 PTS mannitol transporter subunit IICBA [Collibacillus ludicampi]
MKKVDRLGRFFSTMVFQNISGLIAIGLIRVVFGPTGWWPNNEFYPIVNLLLLYYIPIVFAYTGGKMVGGQRGGVIASFVTAAMTAADSTSYPMILPAMVLGPLVGYVIKKVDQWLESRIPVGFELLFYNVVAGITGVSFTILCYFYVAPLFIEGMQCIFLEAKRLVSSGFLPLVALIIEPAKILFLNNVINHGILEPLGIQQTKEFGNSIFFLLESNPGPGFGLLLAYYLHFKGKEKDEVKSSLAIHVLGGIHEVYFPYVLMKPITIIPLILGGMAGDMTFYLLKTGLVATPSPGSILVLLVMAPKGYHMAILAGFIISALVSFLASVLVISREKAESDNDHTSESKEKTMCVQTKTVVEVDKKKTKPVQKIIFACDAGMGSSAMGAALLRKKLRQANLHFIVDNASVDDIPLDADIVISHKHLTERARVSAPSAKHFSITSFVDHSFYQEFISQLQSQSFDEVSERLPLLNERMGLTSEHILLRMEAKDKWEAIEQVGSLLVRLGNVEKAYIEEMKQREHSLSTYLGNGVAVPHGIDANSSCIRKPGIAIAQYPKGIDFGDGNTAYILIAIAGRGPQQLSTLSQLAVMIESVEQVRQLIYAKNKEEIIQIIEENIEINEYEMAGGTGS